MIEALRVWCIGVGMIAAAALLAVVYFGGGCAYCGVVTEEPLHQDHRTPLSKEGGYTLANIVPACAGCNSSKSDTDYDAWVQGVPLVQRLALDVYVKYVEGIIN